MNNKTRLLKTGSSLISGGQASKGRVSMEGAFNATTIQQVVSSSFCDLDMKVANDRDVCRTRFESIALDPIDVMRYQSEGMQRGIRRWEHIRKDSADYISLYIPLSTEFFIEDSQSSITLRPNSFAFIATNRPFSLVQYHDNQDKFYSSIYVKIPADLLRQHVPCIDDMCCKSFPITAGASSIMKAMVETTLDNSYALNGIDASKLGEAVLNTILIAAEWASNLNTPPLKRRKAAYQSLTHKAKKYIGQNLSNSCLNTEKIAHHCGISVRYLHACFAENKETVASHIRERRLQMCRTALRDPLLSNRTITRIAHDWGFTSVSQLGRNYRQRFSCTPREERNHSRK